MKLFLRNYVKSYYELYLTSRSLDIQRHSVDTDVISYFSIAKIQLIRAIFRVLLKQITMG